MILIKKYAEKLIDVKDYSASLAELQTVGEEMIGKNKRIYFDAIADLQSLPKIEKNIKAKPVSIPEDLNGKVEGGEAFDTLIPNEVRHMVDNYKNTVNALVRY